MKHSTTKTGMYVFCLLLIGCSHSASAQAQWKTLFDGKSTDAWRGYKSDSFPGSWKIEDGALKTVIGGKGMDILTKDTFGDFELELEWRISPGGNSGVMYLVTEESELPWHTGLEMQVLDDDKHPDAKRGKDGNRTAGALYDLIPPVNKTLRPVGQYNRVRLVVKGGHVQHWINGRKIVEYDLSDEKFKDIVAQSKFKGLPKFAKSTTGHIVLQYHNDEVWFRNIRVRDLSGR